MAERPEIRALLHTSLGNGATLNWGCRTYVATAGTIRILLFLGPIERAVELFQDRRNWSVWFCEFVDAAAIRDGQHWHLWKRGQGCVVVRDVILEMAEELVG